MTDVEWELREAGPADAERTVLLLPGGMCSAGSYAEVMAEPALAGMRLVAATLPGNAGAPPPDDYSIENYARLTAELARKVGADVVVGFSMGASVALEMVASGSFSGPVVLLGISLSAKDEPAFFRAIVAARRRAGRPARRRPGEGSGLDGQADPGVRRTPERVARGLPQERSAAREARAARVRALAASARATGRAAVPSRRPDVDRPRREGRRRAHRRGARHPRGVPARACGDHPGQGVLPAERGARTDRRRHRRCRPAKSAPPTRSTPAVQEEGRCR